MSAPQMLEAWLSVLMLYVIALRYSEPYFSHDVSSLNMYYAIKMKGLAQWHKTCFFGIVYCDPLVTRKIKGK